jgi:hypothetical protein
LEKRLKELKERLAKEFKKIQQQPNRARGFVGVEL